MSTEESKSIAQRWSEGLNRGDFGVLREMAAPNFVAHQPGASEPVDIDTLEHFGKMFFAAFPDGRVTTDDVFAEDNKVVTRWTFRGTHSSDAMGMPPTGKYVVMPGIEINYVAGGKVTEHWVVFDQLDLMQQLGVIPAQEMPH